jgi:hypothetical protein
MALKRRRSTGSSAAGKTRYGGFRIIISVLTILFGAATRTLCSTNPPPLVGTRILIGCRRQCA